MYTILRCLFLATITISISHFFQTGRYGTIGDNELKTIYFAASVPVSERVVGDTQPQEEIKEADYQATADHSASKDQQGHGTDMSPLFFICIALFIGTATRHNLRKVPVPFTVLLLLIGIGLGVLVRSGFLDGASEGIMQETLNLFSRSIAWAGSIDPHLILFVFLPTLIFEAAFALDVHTFKKSVGNAFILAVPGIILAIIMTAVMIKLISGTGLGLLKWDWITALLFGTLISATDPVAVVALLKELGAGRKLQTLIESESLLNDGTAIVIFLVFLGMITGHGAESNALIQFLQVALGGILIGIVIGSLIVTWIKNVFNDPLFEITVIVGAAYLTFFLAETMHVSGVLGLVTLGLIMASVGRSRISPEVHHFLHEFWELAAFIANTLIFLIVGVVIALRTNFTGKDILVLFVIYLGIILVRGIMLTVFYPLMNRIGYGMPVKHGVVAWWGGLRGAISLALALIVAGELSIDQEIRDQILFLTAGIVLLTSTINATTTKSLVEALGITRLSPAKKLMIINNMRIIRQSSEKELDKIRADRFMSGANWESVRTYLPVSPEELDKSELCSETLAELRKRVLQREKSNYWEQFEEGLLGRNAVHLLSDTIDLMLDSEGTDSISNREDLEYLWRTPRILNILKKWPLIGRWARNRFFERLSNSYDCARGFVNAQNESLKLLKGMALSGSDTDNKNLEFIESEINENRIQGLTFLRNLKEAFPEIYSAIETRQAVRTLLNHEHLTVEKLLKQRRIEPDEAQNMFAMIESKKKKLMNTPPYMKHTLPVDLLKNIPWLADLDQRVFRKVLYSFQNMVFSVGENLIKSKKTGTDIIIIIRGAVKVTMNNQVCDILGPGDVIGEMSLLTGLPRTATVTAESPVSALRLPESVIRQLFSEVPELKDRLWKVAAQRFAENILKEEQEFVSLTQADARMISKTGEIVYLRKGELYDHGGEVLILLEGNISDCIDKSLRYAGIVRLPSYYQFIANKDSRIYVIKQIPVER